MKTPIFKNQSSFLPLLFFSLLIAVGCKKDTKAKKMSANANSYIYAHTSGTISKADPVRVRFTQSIASEEEIGNNVDKGIISFRPGIKGSATWENDRTILFEPSEHWESGISYVTSVKLKKIFDNVPADATTVEFDFQTIEMHFDVKMKGLNAMSNSDLSKQELEGSIVVSDIADNQQVEKLLSASQNNNDLPIRWNHLDNGIEHVFFVGDIVRGEEDGEVMLSWKGNPIGAATTGTKNYTVPSINNFKIMSADAIREGDQSITLYFSDPILPNQNLNGLITIENYNSQLRYAINGTEVKVFPSTRLVGAHKVMVRPGIKNVNNFKMRDQSEWNLSFQDIKPQIRLVGDGVVMPNSNGLVFPFESVSLNAVEVEIFKIFDSNILQFLQTNELNGSSQLERVGRIVMQKKVSLQKLNPNAQFFEWQRYALDLNDLIQTDPNAIYQIRLGFRPEYSTYNCDAASGDSGDDEDDYYYDDYYEDDYYGDNYDGFQDETEFTTFWGNYYGFAGYYDGYNYDHRENPCFPAYYNYSNFVRRNIIASDLGIIAKRGKNGSIYMAVSDIKTTRPVSGVELQFYDYQQQLLKTVSTDGDGIVNTKLDRKPFVVIAKGNGQKGYLNLSDGNSLSVSRFDVSGTTVNKGIKGYIYGERGVWRPGDSLHLNFILEDQSGKLPDNFPITFTLKDAQGQEYFKELSSNNVGRIYPFKIKTNVDDPTGNWTAKVKAGGATFTKNLKIETVKPNRLKINFDLGEEITLVDGKLNGDLQVNWLHGAPAKDLNTQVEIQFKNSNTTFDGFTNYEFDDPTRKLDQNDPQTIFDDNLDAQGKANVTTPISMNMAVAGKLKASFKVRTYEKGGDFSVDNFTLPYSPYESYAGVLIPKNKYGQRRLDINEAGTVFLTSLTENGEPQRGKELSVGLYRVNWRWWWDRGNDNISRYNSSEHLGSLKTEKVYTDNTGKANWDVTVDDWGRYLVRVCDTESGHCSGTFFYAGYPWNDSDGFNKEEAAMLAFNSDKQKYNVGEPVKLSIPAGEEGRALISIESGTEVVESYWMDAQKGDNTFTFYATPEMAPTVYANVSLVQPHAQVQNDLPIRMYGIIPINVEDPDTRLEPILEAPEVMEPEQKVTVKVSEKDGKAMAYTIAMVDDGLLDLTRFKTPNPWGSFYAREALGVQTWDLYDHVLGAYGTELERVLTIGGDGDAAGEGDQSKANRFDPVVRHVGPFYLERGRTAKHEITLPNYVGSVRTMVVAAGNGAYGSAEKTSPVRKPLMILATLPRVIGPGEQLKLPVNVFAMEKKVKNVTVTVEETSGLVDINGENTKRISFSQPGDELVDFDLTVRENIGIAKFKITAKGGGEIATQEIEIDVRNPNPEVTNVYKEVIDPQGEWTLDFDAPGMFGTNGGVLELSNIPPIDLGRRLNYLLGYPHGCLEQTTSKGFPQLYVNRLMELNETQKKKIPENIQATVDRLKRFQRSGGGLSYWPGGNYSNSWTSIYATHFLIEAKNLGYNVSETMLNSILKNQKNIARKWDPEMSRKGMYRYNSDLEQAYRLYMLALAKQPELGAMNRLMEDNKISTVSKWRLANAYAVAGKPEVARKIVNGLSSDVKEYSEMSYTFGSDLRDRAMIAETLLAIDDRKGAADMIQIISGQLNSGKWWSTQSVGYALRVIGMFVGENSVGKNFNFAYQLGGDQVKNAGSSAPIMQIEVPVDKLNSKDVKVTNMSNGILYARLILTGQPVAGDQTEAENNLKMAVDYKDMQGKSIDPETLEQGTDFIAEVTLTNPGTKGMDYNEMALTKIFPSGWEIINSRMDDLEVATVAASKPQYEDIKDDRVYAYYSIPRNKTRTYRIQLNAAYQGKFYLPTTYCEAMYDNTVNARKPGKWVNVVKAGEI